MHRRAFIGSGVAAATLATLSTAAETNPQVVLYSLTARAVAAARFGLDTVIRP